MVAINNLLPRANILLARATPLRRTSNTTASHLLDSLDINPHRRSFTDLPRRRDTRPTHQPVHHRVNMGLLPAHMASQTRHTKPNLVPTPHPPARPSQPSPQALATDPRRSSSGMAAPMPKLAATP